MLPSSVPRQHNFSDIKHTLLDCVEQFLTPLSEGPRCLLELSRVADIYYQRSTAIGLSLAAVRRLQCKEEVFDPRLWLEALSTLAHCLIGHSSSNGLSCEEVCSTGGEQAEALGDYELAARFSHTAALHGLSMMPQDLAVITKHCQVPTIYYSVALRMFCHIVSHICLSLYRELLSCWNILRNYPLSPLSYVVR